MKGKERHSRGEFDPVKYFEPLFMDNVVEFDSLSHFYENKQQWWYTTDVITGDKYLVIGYRDIEYGQDEYNAGKRLFGGELWVLVIKDKCIRGVARSQVKGFRQYDNQDGGDDLD